MDSLAQTNTRTVETISTLTFVTGVLSIGICGFLLMIGIAYAMVTENLALLVVCGFLLFSPFLLGIFWCVGVGGSLLANNAEESKQVAEAYSE